jgi:nucleotide-binding universal stress UspA family protein
MFKRILVPLDGSQLAEKALPYAETLARKFEAELILVEVLQLIPEFVGKPHGLAFYKQPVRDHHEAENYLRGLIDHFHEPYMLPTRTVVLENQSAATTITNLACEEAVDLIVMSTHGRSGLSHLVFGSVAGKVLQDAPCPVFLVKANEADC